MQGGLSGGGGGGGLARFRSAPATWLDALLEDEDSLKLSGPHHPPPSSTSTTTTGGGGGGGLTQLLTGGATSGSASAGLYIPEADPGYFEGGGGGGHHQQVTSSDAFQRMNSSPAEFLSGNVDGYFASYGLGPGSGYDFVGPASASTSTAADHVDVDVDVDVSHGKRLRDNHHDSDQLSPSFLSHHHRRGEQGGQLSATSSGGLLDLEMEKLLEDSVPCRVRAKRGCATHPRSIAERVRRTRISDRIRKLQELVPNMDKQTNTADMLEEAVEYVKTLQKQIQELTELQKKCTCMAKS